MSASPTQGGGVVPTIAMPMFADGSSSIENNTLFETAKLTKTARGHINFAHARSPRFKWINYIDATDPAGRGFYGPNFGVIGSTAPVILNRTPAIFAAYPFEWGLLYSGGNDLEGSTPAATTFATIVDTVNARLAAGVTKLILITVHPRGKGNSGNYIPEGSTYWAKRIELNNLIKNSSWPAGVVVLDSTPSLVLTGSPIEEIDPRYTDDGLHINGLGGSRLGRPLSVVFDTVFGTTLYAVETDPAAPNNIAPNGPLAGTAGSAGFGAAGQLPNNARLSASTNVNYTPTASVIPDDGNGRRIRITGVPTDVADKVYTLRMADNSADSNNIGIAVPGREGQWLKGSWAVRLVDAPEAFKSIRLILETKTASNGGVTLTASHDLPVFESDDDGRWMWLETPPLLCKPTVRTADHAA